MWRWGIRDNGVNAPENWRAAKGNRNLKRHKDNWWW